MIKSEYQPQNHGLFCPWCRNVSKSNEKLIEDWLTWKVRNENCADSTIYKYRGYLERLKGYLLDSHHCSMLECQDQHLTDFTGRFLHSQKVSPRSRHVVVASLKGFYSWCYGKKLIQTDPSSCLVYPKLGRRIPVQLGLSNAEKLLMQPDIDTFIGLRDAAMLSLLMGCGVRVSGLCGLNQGSLFWFEYEGRQRLAIKVTEKGGHERELPVPQQAMLLIQAYLGHEELDGIDRTLADGDQVLFVSVRNRHIPKYDYRGEHRRINQKSIWKMIQKYGEAAGLPAELCHPHAMRHMLGAEMMEDDANTLQIQAVLGHADPKTSEIYAKMARRKMTQILDKMNPLSKINTKVSPLVDEMKKRGVL